MARETPSSVRGWQVLLKTEEGAGTLRKSLQAPQSENLTLLSKQLVEEQLKVIKYVQDMNITINQSA